MKAKTESPDYFGKTQLEADRKENERQAWLDAYRPPAQPPSLYESPQAYPDYLAQVYTWEYVRAKQSVELRPDSTWRDYAVEAGREIAIEAIRHLRRMAEGSEEALAAIADIATRSTETLSNTALREPRRLRPIARSRFFWPFLKARKERFGDDHKRLVKDIELGGAAPLDERAIPRTRQSNVAVKTAMNLLCRLDPYRHQNPAVLRLTHAANWQIEACYLKCFSTQTSGDWFKVAWEALLQEHSGHPELDPGLRNVGFYRAKHSVYNQAQKMVTAQTREANIQDGIKDAIRKAIRRLAAAP